MDNYGPIRITLVHGTWARDAAWTQDGSTFRRQLTRALVARGIDAQIDTFAWTGWDTHAARRAAAHDLKDLLRRQIAADPKARYILVGHSHGGNVALAAVRRLGPLQTHVSHVVTMATPFLVFERNRLDFLLIPRILLKSAGYVGESYLGNTGKWLLLMIATLPITLPFKVFESWLRGKIWGEDHVLPGCHYLTNAGACVRIDHAVIICFAALFTVSIGSVAFSKGRSEVLRSVATRLEGVRRQMLEDHGYVQPAAQFGNVRVLALTSAIDEALGALSGAWWVHRIAGWSLRLTGITMALVVIGAWMLVASHVFTWTIGPHGSRWLAALGSYGVPLAFIVSGSAAFLTLSLAIVFLGRILRRIRLILGLDDPANLFLLTVRAVRAPDLSADTRRYSVREVIDGGAGLLFHSRIYSMCKVAEDIATWIRGEFATDTSTTPPTPLP